jgi:redox-sensitive bicupin YhaK (pirin superfamily)
VRHSEANPSKEEPVHLLQIWILPEREGQPPEYEEKKFADEEKRNTLRLIVSPNGDDGAVRIHQDAKIYASVLDAGVSVSHQLTTGRHAWLQVAGGAVELNGAKLKHGDGAAVSQEDQLSIIASEPSEVLLFDLA